MSTYNFIDLFCGAGGLSTGLKEAGLNEVFACDYNKDSIESMKFNHSSSKLLCEDIRKVTNSEIKKYIGSKKVHLVCGGPPCQGFSTIGKGDPKDIRNTLFKEFVRVVDFLKPEFVLFENVTGMLSKKNEKTLKSIVKSFKKIGYDLQIQILEAQKYGVPQRRKRAFIVGSKSKIFQFPKPTHDYYAGDKYYPPVTLGDVLKKIKGKRVRDINHDIEKTNIKSLVDSKRLKHIPEGRSIRYEEDVKKYLPKRLWPDIDWENIREGRLRECHYRRLDRKLPTPTINTHNHHYYHPVELRKFTLREFALMQGFPLDYKFFGSRTSIIKQIGNAVPPPLAKSIGLELIKSLKSRKKPRDFKGLTTNDINNLRSSAFVY